MLTLHSSQELHKQGRMLSALPPPLGLLTVCGKAEKHPLLLRGTLISPGTKLSHAGVQLESASKGEHTEEMPYHPVADGRLCGPDEGSLSTSLCR